MCQSASRVKLILGLSSTSKVEDLWITRLGTAYCHQTPFSLIVVPLSAMQNSSHLVTSVTNFCSGLSQSGEQELSRLPIESVDILGAGVPKQKRGIIGSHAEPATPKTCLPEVFQIGHPLQLAVANAHSHH